MDRDWNGKTWCSNLLSSFNFCFSRPCWYLWLEWQKKWYSNPLSFVYQNPTTRIQGFSNYASWLDGHVWPHHMYISIKGQGLEKHRYLLTIQFDYDEWFESTSNKPSNQLKAKKDPLVKNTIVSMNRASNKRAIQVQLVKKKKLL